MRKGLWDFGFLCFALLVAGGAAHAYTRAYIVNDTGQAEYTLHVRLTEPAKPGSAGSGQLKKIFQDVTISGDGLTLNFTSPVDPAGILQNELVWIGWLDSDPQLSGQIAWYWWGDATDNPVGGVQYPVYGDTGALTSTDGPQSFGNGPTNNTSLPNGGTIVGGGTPPGNGGPGNSGNPPNSGGNPPGGKTPGPYGSAQAVPEPSTLPLLGGSLVLLFGALLRRDRSRSAAK